ncbi:hypothetical protein [Geitlerinema sp. PCC 7407]|uniref:hypothetical protein n=1 Tax=Geitlerinema sp. PCC 7407 TaxID=1173025 RepID=UPI00029F840D|nr:hypothetical protein [Geitlerinema sp. PCC 7407]AFY67654.1 hypothetical protein GEI7407_3186 [Geitlerinema sp. PCC 7407]
MAAIDVTFDIPAKIAEGLADQTLFRNGGVIQDSSGRVVMWLRELSSNGQAVEGIVPAGGTSSAMSLVGVGSMLTLGVSVLGFGVLYSKVKELESQIQGVKELLETIDQKIDMSFYANFRAALDLARNAFTMSDQNNRHNSALQAINRFLEAEHIYTDLLKKELETKGLLCNKYLLTLCFAYLAEIRCYLELGESDTALRRFQEANSEIQKYIEQYIEVLLTKNPAIYLHPKLKDSINLSRLTGVFQCFDSGLNEGGVFEVLRDDLFQAGNNYEKWMGELPPAVIAPWKVKKGFWGIPDEGKQAIFERLPQVVDEMESAIETSHRFGAYAYELNLLIKAKVSMKQWENLKPKQLPVEQANFIYIVPPNPVMLESAV